MRCLIFLLILIMATSLVAGDYLVVNSKDWHSVYLLGIYAGQEGYDLVYFGNLEEAHLKTQTMSKSSRILAYSGKKDAVLKNYGDYLDYKGYEDFENREFDDFYDLQTDLFKDYDKHVIFDERYGVEALAMAPIIVKDKLGPLFLGPEDQDDIKKIAGSDDRVIGYFPIRTVSSLKGDKITGSVDDNMRAVTKESVDTLGVKMGLITKADAVDPTTLVLKRPNLVYYGDLDLLAEFMNHSDLTVYEAVGGGLGNIVQAAEEKAARDLKILMRFGRAYTQGSRDEEVFDLDTISFDYPFGMIDVIDVKHYPQLNKTVIVYNNPGNAKIQFYSNIEDDGSTFSDDNMHTLNPGMTLAIPYNVSETSGSIIMTTEYGYATQLKYNVKSDEGDSFIGFQVDELDHYEDPKIDLISGGYDDGKGIAILEVNNPNAEELKVFGELILDDGTVQASKTITIEPESKGDLLIYTPYHMYDDIINQPYDVVLYYGEDTTLFKNHYDVTFEPRTIQVTGSVINIFASTPSLLLLILLIILIILGYIYYRYRTNK